MKGNGKERRKITIDVNLEGFMTTRIETEKCCGQKRQGISKLDWKCRYWPISHISPMKIDNTDSNQNGFVHRRKRTIN